MDQSNLLQTLLRLSMKKEIPYSATQLKKMRPERLEEVMEEYKLKEFDIMNEFFVDLALGKLEQVMKNMGFIKETSNLAESLGSRKLFRDDFKSLLSSVTPLLPYVGLLEGVVVCVSEVYENMKEEKENYENKNNDDPPHETEKGKKRDTDPTESSSDLD